MKAKKITALVMAAVMSASVAATTALSVSAADTVTATSTTLNWGTRTVSTEDELTTYDLTNVVLYKTDFSGVSMSNGAIASSDISYDGTNYTVTINFQKVTRSVTVGDLTLTNATATVTDVDASGYGGADLGTVFTAGTDGKGTAVITIPKDTLIDAIPKFSYESDGKTYTVDPEYGITLDFETSFDKSLLNLIPAMTSPSAEITFSISV